MKYLKSYKIFESVEQDVEDILLEINDETYWEAKCFKEEYGWIITIGTVDEDEEYELEGLNPPAIVDETIERLIDFMKESGYDKYEITFEDENNDPPVGDKISINDIADLDVWPHNWIKVEFWNEKLYK